MIVSASRRTDIPAFYAEWFVNRVLAGYCTVPNPFNPQQISRVSLLPDDVDVIVFWTRNARPLFPHLDDLNARGYRYYFQYTIMDNPRAIDVRTPSLPSSLRTFQELSDLVGPEKVIWRYDPILFSSATGVAFHIDAYRRIAEALRGYTRRSVVSIGDLYAKTHKRLRALKEEQGIEVFSSDTLPGERFDELMHGLVHIAKENELEIVSCAEPIDLQRYGIRPGKCIDDDLIREVFGIEVTDKKDPGQRKACGCVVSKDIGMYNTCLFGCLYCYATDSFKRARANYEKHDPTSPSLIG
jgi:hypothetical protein